MAGLQGNFNLSGISLTNSAANYLIAIVAPTNQRLLILSWKLSFNGTNSANTPALVSHIFLTGGTWTNTAVAPVKTNDANGVGETLQASSKNTNTVAPTTTYTTDAYYEPVFGGFIGWQFTPGQELVIPGGSIYGLVVTPPQAVSCTLSINYSE